MLVVCASPALRGGYRYQAAHQSMNLRLRHNGAGQHDNTLPGKTFAFLRAAQRTLKVFHDPCLHKNWKIVHVKQWILHFGSQSPVLSFSPK